MRKKTSLQDLAQTYPSCHSSRHTTNPAVRKAPVTRLSHTADAATFQASADIPTAEGGLTPSAGFRTASFFIFVFGQNEIPALGWTRQCPLGFQTQPSEPLRSVPQGGHPATREPRCETLRTRNQCDRFKKELNGVQLSAITYVHIILQPSPPATHMDFVSRAIPEMMRTGLVVVLLCVGDAHVSNLSRTGQGRSCMVWTCVATDCCRITLCAPFPKEHFLDMLRSSQLGEDICFQRDFVKHSICQGDSVASTSPRGLCRDNWAAPWKLPEGNTHGWSTSIWLL
ncbi:uncharacterized protein LOC103660760 [Ursus maritimus]|uniref:Uncharacterized protein LOC103660760 n=1 Tax=Ursus maritimus TaxID=29073 RepID=A0A8M1FWN0_URSMA|nr:uncharacterized protein LOC103660760 [Ursus maritimus]